MTTSTTDPDVGLILPGSVAYAVALATMPPAPTWEAEAGEGNTYLICRAGSQGLMEAVDYATWLEYVNDGELDERQDEIDALDNELEGIIW